MWTYIALFLAGAVFGFFARIIQHAFYEASHTETIGTLNVVSFENGQNDLLLELNDSPDKLLNGQFVTLDVRKSRR